MAKTSTKFNKIINERSTADYIATLQDTQGNVLAGSAIVSLTLTLYELKSGAIINNRDGQNVLNQNDVTVDENGALLFSLQPDDGVIIDADCEYETHRAEFDCVFNAGAGRSTWDVDFFYRNLSKLNA